MNGGGFIQTTTVLRCVERKWRGRNFRSKRVIVNGERRGVAEGFLDFCSVAIQVTKFALRLRARPYHRHRSPVDTRLGDAGGFGNTPLRCLSSLPRHLSENVSTRILLR